MRREDLERLSLVRADAPPIRARGRAVVIAGGALLLLSVGGLIVHDRGAFAPGEKAPAARAARPAVRTETVSVTEPQMQQIRLDRVALRRFRAWHAAVGQIALNEDLTTPIFAPYAGRITRMAVRAGDLVERGELLFEIDSPDLVQAEGLLIGAVAAAQKARDQLELANRSLARQRELYAVKAVAQKAVEQAEADQRGADSDLRGAAGTLAAARSAVRLFGKTDAEIARIEAERRTDAIMPVRAPLAGTVVARRAGPGQLVQPSNADPVLVIADLSTVWLVANVPETDVAAIHVGDAVEVRIAAYPNDTFRARVANIGAVVDPTTRRVTVRSAVEPRGRQLKPQMFASFRIAADEGPPTIAVPTTAVLRDVDTTTVWVEVAPRTFAPRRVERGLEQNGVTQILSGLSPDDTVVVEGAIFLGNALAMRAK